MSKKKDDSDLIEYFDLISSKEADSKKQIYNFYSLSFVLTILLILLIESLQMSILEFISTGNVVQIIFGIPVLLLFIYGGAMIGLLTVFSILQAIFDFRFLRFIDTQKDELTSKEFIYINLFRAKEKLDNITSKHAVDKIKEINELIENALKEIDSQLTSLAKISFSDNLYSQMSGLKAALVERLIPGIKKGKIYRFTIGVKLLLEKNKTW